MTNEQFNQAKERVRSAHASDGMMKRLRNMVKRWDQMRLADQVQPMDWERGSLEAVVDAISADEVLRWFASGLEAPALLSEVERLQREVVDLNQIIVDTQRLKRR